MTMTLYELATADGTLSSPYCWKVREALLMLAIPFESREMSFLDIQTHFKGTQKTVPVLSDQGNDIGGSWAILVHISQHYDPEQRLTGGKAGYGLSSFINHWVDATVWPALVRMIVNDICESCTPADQEYFRPNEEARHGATLLELQGRREQERPAFQTLLHPARRAVKERPFIGGKTPTIADMALHSCFQSARAVSKFELLREDDHLHGWIERMDAWVESVTPASAT